MSQGNPWDRIPHDLRLILLWLGYAPTDARTGVIRVNVRAAVERLRRAARQLEELYLPVVEAALVDEPGPLQSAADAFTRNVRQMLVPPEARLPKRARGTIKRREARP